nr:MAG TPA: hypothetical protein [Caudoviricetes sp.]
MMNLVKGLLLGLFIITIVLALFIGINIVLKWLNDVNLVITNNLQRHLAAYILSIIFWIVVVVFVDYNSK